MGVAKKRGDMGNTGYNKDDWKAWRWCIRNDIAIAPKAKSENSWYVVIKQNGKLHESPETYSKTIIWQKIFEYCKYYYQKYRHEENKHTK